MAKDLLLEIGTEEMPSGAAILAIEQLKEKAQKILEDNRLSYIQVQTLGTPRRLALVVKGVAERQEEILQEVKGPAQKVAYTSEGKPTAAALGFAKAQGVKVDTLVAKETPQGEYVFVLKKELGKPALQLLPSLLSGIVKSLSFPKSMRWDEEELRFVRPIRWLLAFYGEKVVPFSLGSLKSSNRTWGHRLLCREPLKVENSGEYFGVMRKGKIIVDQKEREKIIQEEIVKAAREAAQVFGGKGVKAVINPRVLEEVVYLVEFPQTLWGKFSEEYLRLPPEVLITAMESHQRYFPLQGEKGLLPAFVLVHNGDQKSADIIRRGHERVLGTRLADARFFYEEDQKTTLESKVKLLKGVVFQERLGTLYDKTARIKSLVKKIGQNLNLSHPTLKKAERAAYLSKADLVSEMVTEFPTLQGEMGRVYARLSQEPEEVAQALCEQYLPRSAGDSLPKTILGQILSIADKIDTISGCFLINLIPSGSEDPYLLRRQAQGILSIILDNELPISFEELIEFSLENYKEIFKNKQREKEVEDFFKGRLRGYFLNEGVRYDILDSVLTTPLEDILDLKKRIEALTQYPKGRLEDIFTAFTRCNNIAQPPLGSAVKPDLLQEKEEKTLYEEITKAQEKVAKFRKEDNHLKLLDTLAELRPFVDSLFDQVLIMAEEKELRENRLALLNRTLGLFFRVADFSKLVMEATNKQ